MNHKSNSIDVINEKEVLFLKMTKECKKNGYTIQIKSIRYKSQEIDWHKS